MIKRSVALASWIFLIFCWGCESQAIQKTTKPVVEPIKKTADTVFRERKIGSEDKAQAVIFPREEEQEHKQFKLKF